MLVSARHGVVDRGSTPAVPASVTNRPVAGAHLCTCTKPSHAFRNRSVRSSAAAIPVPGTRVWAKAGVLEVSGISCGGVLWRSRMKRSFQFDITRSHIGAFIKLTWLASRSAPSGVPPSLWHKQLNNTNTTNEVLMSAKNSTAEKAGVTSSGRKYAGRRTCHERVVSCGAQLGAKGRARRESMQTDLYL